MKPLHRFVDWLNAHGPLLFLTPNISSIGNGSEDIYFGLLRARREGKRLVILYPYDLPWKFRFPLVNSELLDLASPYRYELPAPLMILARLALTVLCGPFNLVNRILGKLFGPRAMIGRFSHPRLGRESMWQPRMNTADFEWTIVKNYHWAEQIESPLPVTLKPVKQARASRILIEMGIPNGAWFVALHVRESGFLKDSGSYNHRNGTIANYIPAIEEIVARGGWVIRMGDETMQPLPSMKNVIDYPHTRFKSQLMDMHLLRECRFFIGMPSGILDTAYLFQRPTLTTNVLNIVFVHPRRPQDRAIPKHVYSKSMRRFLSLRELIDVPWDVAQFTYLENDFELRENSPAELRNATREFMDDLESGRVEPTQLQAEARRRCIENGRKLIDSDPSFDCTLKYMMACRLESSRGHISQFFLDENWEHSVLDRPSVGGPA